MERGDDQSNFVVRDFRKVNDKKSGPYEKGGGKCPTEEEVEVQNQILYC